MAERLEERSADGGVCQTRLAYSEATQAVEECSSKSWWRVVVGGLRTQIILYLLVVTALLSVPLLAEVGYLEYQLLDTRHDLASMEWIADRACHPDLTRDLSQDTRDKPINFAHHYIFFQPWSY